MFELNINKDQLLPALTAISGAVDRRQALAVLSNILFECTADDLRLTATDLEIEMSIQMKLTSTIAPYKITIPARKLIEIIRSLDQDQIVLKSASHGISLLSGRSHFKLSSIDADQFPNENYANSEFSSFFSRLDLIHLLESTYFAISQQEHRAYLTALLLEFNTHSVTAVSTDGHRMAICRVMTDFDFPLQQYLLPRRGVAEMLKLLNTLNDDTVQLKAGAGFFNVFTDTVSFTTKLIEARYPNYRKAIPLNNDKFILIERDILKRALGRAMILANEKTRAVLFQIQSGVLLLAASNQDHEEATEVLEAHVDGQDIKIWCNANYLLDVLQHLPDGLVRISMSTTNHSILVESLQNEHYQYIIMPLTV